MGGIFGRYIIGVARLPTGSAFSIYIEGEQLSSAHGLGQRRCREGRAPSTNLEPCRKSSFIQSSPPTVSLSYTGFRGVDGRYPRDTMADVQKHLEMSLEDLIKSKKKPAASLGGGRAKAKAGGSRAPIKIGGAKAVRTIPS